MVPGGALLGSPQRLAQLRAGSELQPGEGGSCLEEVEGATPMMDGVRIPLHPRCQSLQLGEKSGASQGVMGPRLQDVGSPAEQSCQKGLALPWTDLGKETRTCPLVQGLLQLKPSQLVFAHPHAL